MPSADGRGLTEMGPSADGPLEHLLDTLLTRLTSGVCEDDIALLAARRPPGRPCPGNETAPEPTEAGSGAAQRVRGGTP
ncbi:hypothetical protein [Streptomyces sp. NPDC006527]|uniref:hypothetical protein n=1 Tax=Streptomyces sp. NPDC006527 TaxID=3364749 RepID=UPI003682C2AD